MECREEQKKTDPQIAKQPCQGTTAARTHVHNNIVVIVAQAVGKARGNLAQISARAVIRELARA